MISVLPRSELSRLAATAEAEGLALSDLVPVCESYGAAPTDVLNELSILIAEGYLNGSLAYAFCNDAINGIINAVVDLSITGAMPQPAFSLYQAFDEGECLSSEEPPGTNARAKSTKSRVEEIMCALKAALEVG